MEVRAAGEGIRSSKEVAWDVDDFQVEIRKVKQPSCLATVKVMGLMEVRQVLVVGEDLDGERGSVEIMSPRLQSADDCEELPVIDVVVSFRWNEQLREVGAGVPVAVRVSLEEDGA